jgi:hypothetical protein
MTSRLNLNGSHAPLSCRMDSVPETVGFYPGPATGPARCASGYPKFREL